MKVKAGDVLMFKGVVWDEHWEFDCPCIVYTPIPRYNPNEGSISRLSIVGLVEDICIDLCLGEDLSTEFHADDLREFKWRGWSVRGFNRRRNAVRATIPVCFFMEDGELSFKYLDRRDEYGRQDPNDD